MKNYKILSYNLMTKNNINDISREKYKINGVELYILKSYLPELSQRFIKKFFKIKYDEKVYEKENIELYKEICETILEKLNQKYNNEYKTNEKKYQKAKTFVQFYKDNWNKNKNGIHFELVTDTTNWFDKKFNLNLELHIESDTADEELLNEGITKDEEFNNIALYEHNPIKKTISVDFETKNTNEETIENNNHQIEKIYIALETLIEKYSDKIDKVFKDDKEI